MRSTLKTMVVAVVRQWRSEAAWDKVGIYVQINVRLVARMSLTARWGSDFRLSLRSLRTAVNYAKAGGKAPGILLDLTSTERAILEQAFGLVESDKKQT